MKLSEIKFLAEEILRLTHRESVDVLAKETLKLVELLEVSRDFMLQSDRIDWVKEVNKNGIGFDD